MIRLVYFDQSRPPEKVFWILVTELGRRMTKFTTKVRLNTDEIYTRLDDEQTERQLIVGQLNMLYRDRHAYARTVRLMEAEAMMSREA
ncbi:hypothetical protein Tco_0338971 [Tanacetum coccineum]